MSPPHAALARCALAALAALAPCARAHGHTTAVSLVVDGGRADAARRSDMTATAVGSRVCERARKRARARARFSEYASDARSRRARARAARALAPPRVNFPRESVHVLLTEDVKFYDIHPPPPPIPPTRRALRGYVVGGCADDRVACDWWDGCSFCPRVTADVLVCETARAAPALGDGRAPSGQAEAPLPLSLSLSSQADADADGWAAGAARARALPPRGRARRRLAVRARDRGRAAVRALGGRAGGRLDPRSSRSRARARACGRVIGGRDVDVLRRPRRRARHGDGRVVALAAAWAGARSDLGTRARSRAAAAAAAAPRAPRLTPRRGVARAHTHRAEPGEAGDRGRRSAAPPPALRSPTRWPALTPAPEHRRAQARSSRRGAASTRSAAAASTTRKRPRGGRARRRGASGRSRAFVARASRRCSRGAATSPSTAATAGASARAF